MIATTPLVDGSQTPGIYRVLAEPGEIVQALGEAGWSPVVVPPVARTRDFYTEITRALELPEYFGRNADALWDSLTELTGPTALVLLDWTRYAQARPERWSRILGVLAERTEQRPAFAVVLA
jgi:RNAse (barnase) inhibitor barstar